MAKLVIGLGNPGPEYEETRHNVGFRVLDRLAAHEGLIFDSAKSSPSLEGYTGPRRFVVAELFEPHALLVKPTTFVNRSGSAVAPLARFAEAPPDQVLVVYDDLDLDLGRLRLRPHGGPGTHNGMRSIVEELGSRAFPRLRIGIGPARGDVAEFVLAPFAAKEREEIEISIAEAAEAVLAWVTTGDIEACMTRFHTRWNT